MNVSFCGYRPILGVVQGLFLGSALALPVAAIGAERPDAIIRNAKVLTVDRNDRIAEAVALKGTGSWRSAPTPRSMPWRGR
jgi:hypothetical protein